MIQLEISVLGSKDCSEQPLFNVAIRNSSCGAVKSCYGYNLDSTSAEPYVLSGKISSNTFSILN